MAGHSHAKNVMHRKNAVDKKKLGEINKNIEEKFLLVN